MTGYGLVCLGLSGIFFAAVQDASGAAWSTAFRRVPGENRFHAVTHSLNKFVDIQFRRD